MQVGGRLRCQRSYVSRDLEEFGVLYNRFRKVLVGITKDRHFTSLNKVDITIDKILLKDA